MPDRAGAAIVKMLRNEYVLIERKQMIRFVQVAQGLCDEACEQLETDPDLARDAPAPRDRPAIVCLCGSGRFREAFERAEFDETLAGKIVLTIGCNTKDIARDVDWQHVKPMLDELHLRKIDLADEVLILNVGGYIGESTARELAYARSLGKTVRFWEPDLARDAPAGEG